jgi:hypothetical protein
LSMDILLTDLFPVLHLQFSEIEKLSARFDTIGRDDEGDGCHAVSEKSGKLLGR